MNKQTIFASYKIKEILDKLWVDGDISSTSISYIMERVNEVLNFENK